MSYDYLLVRSSTGGGLEALVEGAMSQTVGTVEQVQESIGALFSTIRWNKGPGEGWFDRCDEAEFTFLVEPEGRVRMIQMSRCERETVELVVNELGLVAIDEQSMEQFDG